MIGILCSGEACDCVCLVSAHGESYESKFEVHEKETYEGQLACLPKMFVVSTRTITSTLPSPCYKTTASICRAAGLRRKNVSLLMLPRARNGQSQYGICVQSLDPANPSLSQYSITGWLITDSLLVLRVHHCGSYHCLL